MELRIMENSIRVREVIDQLRFASLEVAHGCQRAVEIGPDTEDVALLTAALAEMHRQAKNLHESMAIEKKSDHDGDTEPANEAPEPPKSFVERYDAEPPWMRDRTPCQCGHERDVHGPAGPATPTEGLVCYVVDCPCKQFAGAVEP
jgi:hypothetical protein